MRVGLGSAILAGSVALVVLAIVTNAFAGGTAVIADGALTPADCQPGAAARVVGFDTHPVVLACAGDPRASRTLFAAEPARPRDGGYRCFYAVAAGTMDVATCMRRPAQAPLSIEPLGAGASFRGSGFVAGIVSRDAVDVLVRSGSRLGAADPWSTVLFPATVERRAADAAGVPDGLGLFVAKLPGRVNPCSGIVAYARDPRGGRIGKPVRFRGRALGGSGIKLPGTRACDTAEALDEVGRSVRRWTAGVVG